MKQLADKKSTSAQGNEHAPQPDNQVEGDAGVREYSKSNETHDATGGDDNPVDPGRRDALGQLEGVRDEVLKAASGRLRLRPATIIGRHCAITSFLITAMAVLTLLGTDQRNLLEIFAFCYGAFFVFTLTLWRLPGWPAELDEGARFMSPVRVTLLIVALGLLGTGKAQAETVFASLIENMTAIAAILSAFVDCAASKRGAVSDLAAAHTKPKGTPHDH